MAKTLLKRLLLVTLVLCISMLSMTAVFAEEPEEPIEKAPKLYVYAVEDAAGVISVHVRNAVMEPIVNEEIDITDETAANWVFLIEQECNTDIVLPEDLSAEGIYFVNSTITSYDGDKTERTNRVIDLFVSLAKKGIPVYVFATEKSDEGNIRPTLMLHIAYRFMGERADDPENEMIRSEDEEGVFLVPIDEETYGYIYTYVVPGTTFDALDFALEMLKADIFPEEEEAATE